MDINRLIELFNRYDIDKSGFLNKEELEKANLSSVFSRNNVSFETFSNSDYIKGLSVERQDYVKDNNVLTLNPLRPNNKFQRPIIKITDYEQLPAGSHNNIRDARGCDISKIFLSQTELTNLIIDETTVLSNKQKERLKVAFENGKNPGLGIRKLQEQGITGKGVRIAIIDQPLAGHKEYNDRIINYEEIGFEDYPNWVENGSMHGSAVTSIAAGKNIGVAPESEVVFFAAMNMTENVDELKQIKTELKTKIEDPNIPDHLKEYYKDAITEIETKGFATVNKNYADAIIKILDINKNLLPEEQIPVISISWGFDNALPDYNLVEDAIARAKKEGVFVISTSLDRFYAKGFNGANRDPIKDPDDPKNYKAGAFWEDFTGHIPLGKRKNTLLVPMDHRTVADFKDSESYRFEGNDGGMSWATPYLAGVYALAKQVNPSLKPEDFLKAAFDTSDECRNPNGVFAGRLINPEKLIEKIKPEF